MFFNNVPNFLKVVKTSNQKPSSGVTEHLIFLQLTRMKAGDLLLGVGKTLYSN